MAGNQSDALPEPLEEWVEEQAAAADVDTTDVVARAVTLYRLVEEHAEGADGGMPPVDDIDDLLDDLEAVEERLSALDRRLDTVDGLDERVSTLTGRVEAVEGDLDAKVDDVRERVIQVRREADAKAATDHDHPALDDRIARAAESAERANERVDDVAGRVDRGFENYEEVLDRLADGTERLNAETDRLDERLTRVASVVVDLRRRTATAERRLATRDAAADLKRAANRQGETAAACGDCDRRVAIGLLAEPTCPHCESTFAGVESASGFFGSATLVTERRPAATDGEGSADGGGDRAVGHDDATDATDATGTTEAAGTPATLSELFGATK
jgi:hypothetical protein